MSAREFFGVTRACRFEPSLGIDEREVCDAVTCFDVLEHIFVTDVSSIVAELFSLARKLVIVNVA
jgi:2-polyprenyl-3-methyl-5-hydroxy-6-metoxy-1,4-benzoquinol methylase